MCLSCVLIRFLAHDVDDYTDEATRLAPFERLLAHNNNVCTAAV
jgi:hypothetical protein